MRPPKHLYVEVRVVKECGEVVTEGGVVHLDLHSRHFLRRSDVEYLIRQGRLVQVD